MKVKFNLEAARRAERAERIEKAKAAKVKALATRVLNNADRNTIAKGIFQIVSEMLYSSNLARNVTGMLMDLSSTELYTVLDSRDSLKAKVGTVIVRKKMY